MTKKTKSKIDIAQDAPVELSSTRIDGLSSDAAEQAADGDPAGDRLAHETVAALNDDSGNAAPMGPEVPELAKGEDVGALQTLPSSREAADFDESTLEPAFDESLPAANIVKIDDLGFDEPMVADEPESIPSEIEDETAFVEEMPEAVALKSIGEMKAALECLFFTTTHPLSLARLRLILGDIDLKTLRGAVVQLQMEYDARGSGLQVVETAEGFQMCTRPDYANVVLRLHRQRKKNPLTITALETLAIVAYKQPITRAEIEMIRGVETSGVLRNLLDMGMVKVVGRKEVIGRPQLYGTTSIFLRTFGLKSITEMPTLQQLRRQYVEQPLFPSQSDGAGGSEESGESTSVLETGQSTESAESGGAGESASLPENTQPGESAESAPQSPSLSAE